MIPEFGQYALIIAACLAIVQIIVPVIGIQKNNTALLFLAKRTAFLQCAFVSLAFMALAFSFVINDFSVVYVAQNSNTSLPWIYRFCAVWGAHEGSLLLWLLILTIWMSAVSVFSKQLPSTMVARVLVVLAIIALGFYGFLLTTSNPFLRYLPNVPLNGRDLNPILQDPGLAMHPPILYLGYVGLSVPFAFAIATLWQGKFDAVWARWTRPWTLLAWCFLTLGIILGSWWAYRELGWGGFWFWDPVENAAFLPWLATTALLHTLIVAEKRDVFKAWSILLTICAFTLSLLGTFLVRSGVLISVHAFANDPRRGLYLLEFLALLVSASLALYAWRSHKIINSGRFAWLSRESVILSNNILLFVAMLTVLIGTLYPLIVDVLRLNKISVGAPYFNTIFFPLMWPLLFLMGLAPYSRWQYTTEKSLKTLFIAFLAALLLAILIDYLLTPSIKPMAILGGFLALWIIFNSLRCQWAMLSAHIGVAITVLGLVFVSLYTQSRNVIMQPGDKVTMAGYTFQLNNIQALEGANYSGAQANVIIERDAKLVSVLHPQQRLYHVERSAVAKTAIDATPFRDLYVALGAPLPNGAWQLRFYYKPMVRWIWWGGFFMILGGVLALFTMIFKKSRH